MNKPSSSSFSLGCSRSSSLVRVVSRTLSRTLARTWAATLVAGLGAGFAGCASSSGATQPGAPVTLDGAQYKLLAAGGSLDGRVVEFLKRGPGLMGCLISPGSKLRGVAGIENGTWVFSMQEKATNEFEGVYRAINADGSIAEKQVAASFNGDNLSWNLESATWERQSGSNQLTADEKAKCTKR